MIADAIIKMRNLNIKTKYIYGSKKAWRIPSYFDKIDEVFEKFGNFQDINNYQKLLEALELDDEKFGKLFPELLYLKNKKNYIKKDMDLIIKTIKNKDNYKKYLLQEIDFSEKYAFVDFWGLGYNQDCLARVISKGLGIKDKVIFYYAYTVFPDKDNSIRLNKAGGGLTFIETFFANVLYLSTEGYYEDENGKILPIYEKNYNSKLSLHNALEKYLVDFKKSILILRGENVERFTGSCPMTLKRSNIIIRMGRNIKKYCVNKIK